MGTNSKSSHASHVIAPTAVHPPSPPAPVVEAPDPNPQMTLADLLGGTEEPSTPAQVSLDLPPLAPEADPFDGLAAPNPVKLDPPPFASDAAPVPETDAALAVPPHEVAAAPESDDAATEAGSGLGEELGPAASPEPEALVEGPAEAVPDAVGQPDAPDPAAQTAAEAVPVVQEDEEDAPLTPIPDAPPVGSPTGAPILVGGEDFVNAQATLVAYQSAAGPREVLLAHVSEDAEGKLLEALSISKEQMVDVQVEEQVAECLDLDTKHQLSELVLAATTSAQHKLKTGAAMSENTILKHEKALSAVQSVLATPGLSDDEKAMAQHYLDQVNLVGEKINNGGEPMGYFTPYTHEVTKMVTKQVPGPAPDPEPGTLSAQLRKASRIKAKLDADTGETSWNGKSRTKANGQEYAIDLGEGWSAVYRPYADNDPTSTEFSMRGQLEVHAPVGAGHGKELVERLEQLHLVNKPMTAAEGEWTYLANNITAQDLGSKPGMAEAMATAGALEELQVQELVHARHKQLLDLGPDELHHAVKRIKLEAARKSLPLKVAVVRDAVAKATGFGSGDALAANPGYTPTPDVSGGWLTWSRFDVTGNHDAIKNAFTGKSLTHHVTGGNLLSVFQTGVLASTEKRAVMGIGGGLGMSEKADKYTGGANSVFVRVAHTPSNPATGYLVWDDPSVLMRRSDYYAYDSDQFGVSPDKKAAYGMTRDPLKIATHQAYNNEIMFRDGIDLLGAEAPSRIMCGSPTEREGLLQLFATRGITHLGGKPVHDVVKTA
ncbi:MAG: hypothetical protein HOV68_05340 [Streptomycetaceae bacterium]|nr:hypothetical protein [Streptomycetaceae bacterium]